MACHFAFRQLLEFLPKKKKTSLYTCPYTCEAAFQSLSPVSQQFVLRLLSVDYAVTLEFCSAWATPEARNTSVYALKEAVNMKIIVKMKKGKAIGPDAARVGRSDAGTEVAAKSTTSFRLQPTFRAKMLESVSKVRRGPWAEEAAALAPDAAAPSVAQLNEEAQRRWDSVLHFMVRSKKAARPSREVVQLLIDTGLMNRPGRGGGGTGGAGAGAGAGAGSGGGSSAAAAHASLITRAGYEFLLKDTSFQMWTFLVQYIKSSEKPPRTMVLAEVAQFVFKLSFCTVGRGYPLAALTDTQKRMLPDMASLGLLIAAKDRFYPTFLAASLTLPAAPTSSSKGAPVNRSAVALGPSGPEEGKESSPLDLKIIVEKNFKVYVYTTSPLAVALVGLFVHMEYKLPNLAAGTLTRESVHAALRNGITAVQITQFLMQRAHPKCIASPPIIPDNVVDQLHLWEQEKKRVHHVKATLITDFTSVTMFDQVVTNFTSDKALASAPGGNEPLVFTDRDNLLLCVRAEAYEGVVAFIKSLRA